MTYTRILAAALVAAALSGSTLTAQAPVSDAATRLREALGQDVAERVLATIASARASELPAVALENRALKFAARGVEPKNIERSIAEHAQRMGVAQAELAKARGKAPSGEEIDAGAEAMRKGMSGADIKALATEAPSGRSLAVPLTIIGNLIDRGLPSADALTKVQTRLAERATDTELEQLPSQVATRGQKPAQTGRDLAATKRPGAARGGAPSGVPAGAPVGVPVPQKPSLPTTPRP
jgi:hypothetical protein